MKEASQFNFKTSPGGLVQWVSGQDCLASARLGDSILLLTYSSTHLARVWALRLLPSSTLLADVCYNYLHWKQFNLQHCYCVLAFFRASIVTCISRLRDVHVNRKMSHVGERLPSGRFASRRLKHKVRENIYSPSLRVSEKPYALGVCRYK